jgi:hypothetical protein
MWPDHARTITEMDIRIRAPDRIDVEHALGVFRTIGYAINCQVSSDLPRHVEAVASAHA